MSAKNIKVNFILPFKPRRPAGGFRIMYEYANRLAKKGYTVHLTFPVRTKYMEYRLPYFLRRMLSFIEGFRTNKWFRFDDSITMSYAPEVKNEYVPDADIIIATWWTTVLEMGCLNEAKGKKINLVQGYENWTGHEDELFASYNIEGMTNIVVAPYLEEIVNRHTANKTILIPNSIDESAFHIKKPIEQRNPLTAAMTYSTQEIKGSVYGLEALQIVKQQIPDLRAELFGVCPQPNDLPDWITYHRNPSDLSDLYNRNAIFMSNSFTEGFPLTPAEAMFCGCALVCTDIDGHRSYATNIDTALLVRPKDAQDMADKVLYLINNNAERIALAHKGNVYMQRFRWENAMEKMEEVIQINIKNLKDFAITDK